MRTQPLLLQFSDSFVNGFGNFHLPDATTMLIKFLAAGKIKSSFVYSEGTAIALDCTGKRKVVADFIETNSLPFSVTGNKSTFKIIFI